MSTIYTDQRSKPVETVIAWIATVLTLGFMLPWAIAASRGKANSLAVFLVNLFLGLTVIGWIVALVMSLTGHRAIGVGGQSIVINQVNGNQSGPVGSPQFHQQQPLLALGSQAAPGWYPQPDGSMRWWDGQQWAAQQPPPAPPAPPQPVPVQAIEAATATADTLIQPLSEQPRQIDPA